MVGVASLLLVGGAAYAATRPAGPGAEPRRVGNVLADQQQAAGEARAEGQQVLGGVREAGHPTVQRIRHDRVWFTVSIAPARPGPNLVRVDALPIGQKSHAQHRGLPLEVGTTESDLVEATSRPGTDGQWAVVDLPPGTSTVLVTHGPRHRVPFPVEVGVPADDPAAGSAGDADARALWTGPDGPECLSAASAAYLAGGDGAEATASCPAAGLSEADRISLDSVVDTLTTRGVEEIAVTSDESPRGREALEAVTARAADAGVDVVPAGRAPGERNALLVTSGWSEAAEHLATEFAKPLPEQAIRSDGTWLAPWLLSPGVVDSTPGAILALDFDIRDTEARQFSDALSTYLPGQAPTSSAFAAWQSVRDEDRGDLRLFSASRVAFMPKLAGHAGHETEVAWFPGGTVTPVGLPATSPGSSEAGQREKTS